MGVMINVSGNKNTEITINGKKIEVKDKESDKDKWRAKKGEIYLYIDSLIRITTTTNKGTKNDYRRYELGNYSSTMVEAYRKLDKILEILKQ